MAIVKRLKVYSPVTADGRKAVLKQIPGERGLFPVERISYVELAAKAEIEKLNRNRNADLKERFEEVFWDTNLNQEVGAPKAKPATPKVDKEKDALKATVAELEAKLKALEAEKPSEEDAKESKK